jgi:capsid protein
MQWVDPLKDAEATATMIAGGLKSRRQAVAELGYDVEALDAEIAADRQREAAMGLSFTPTQKEPTNAA